MGQYKYFGNSKRPYQWQVCPVCGVDGWFLKGTTYCSVSCAKKVNAKGRERRFIGTTTEYDKLHRHVREQRGSANKCGNGCESSRYQWANLTGDYDNVQDYIMMCEPCHIRFDRWRVAVIVCVF